MGILDILLGGIVVFALLIGGIVFLGRKMFKGMFEAYQKGVEKGAVQGTSKVLLGMTAKNIRTVISKIAHTIYFSREESLGKGDMSIVDDIIKDLEGFFERELRKHFSPDEMEILVKTISNDINDEIYLDKVGAFSLKFRSISTRIIKMDLAEYVYKKYGVNIETIVKEIDGKTA